MPKAGEVRVRTCRADIWQAVRWIAAWRPTLAAETILGGPVDQEACAEQMRGMTRLRAVLTKMAQRKRSSGTLVVPIERSLLTAFEHAHRNALVQVRARPASHSLPLAFAEAVEAALLTKAGRPSLSSGDRQRRLVPGYLIHERQAKRLRRSGRIDAAHRQWRADIQARGETILTATIAPPKN